MSEKPNDVGSAFPQTSPFGSSGGMTLRDWLAAHETIDPNEHFGRPLSERFAGPTPKGNWETNPFEWFEWSNRLIAKVRYARADAMLAEREKGKNE